MLLGNKNDDAVNFDFIPPINMRANEFCHNP